MTSDPRKPAEARSTLLREAAGLVAPAALAVALLLVAPVGRPTEARAGFPSEEESGVPLCERWHRGEGETTPLDLLAVKAAYAKLKKKLEASLTGLEVDARGAFDRPIKSRLPSCTRIASRTEKVPKGIDARFRGRTLYFLAAPRPERVRLPEEIARNPEAEVFVLDGPNLRDVAGLAKTLTRPVRLATAEFARALGVRCANTRVFIPEKGDTLDLHEGL